MLTPEFCYVLGYLKEEGSTLLGKSNYRRLTITNSEPIILKFVLDKLEKSGLFSKTQLIQKSLQIIHHKINDLETVRHWSGGLIYL